MVGTNVSPDTHRRFFEITEEGENKTYEINNAYELFYTLKEIRERINPANNFLVIFIKLFKIVG